MSNLGFIKDGATVQLKGVILRDPIKTVTACVAAGGQGGAIEVWSGGTSGTLLARVEVPHTGGWTTWREIVAPVSDGKQGRHDLTLVFRGEADYLFNLDWIRFNSARSMVVK
jgi:hypothetical protein